MGLIGKNFKKKGINTSVELCAAILEETGVAVLPGADFGREPEELTARIAYVDFDGKTALEGAGQLSEGKNFDTFMVKQYCPRLVEAFERIGNWLTEL
ncbi:MAG: hypothetical protein K9G47_07265 [Bacteroidales bacterium]|nr:hypothetical protein [Bacteroidales bacterium]